MKRKIKNPRRVPPPDKKIEIEHDACGEWKSIDNGRVKVRILKKASKEYEKKLKARRDKNSERIKQRDIEIRQERMIKERMRDIAIRELKEEGKL